MANYVIPLDVSRQIADSQTGASALLDGAKLGLFTNDVTPTPTTKLSDLTPATFAGGGLSAALVWGAAFIGADGQIHLTAPSHLFVATATPSPGQTVVGAFVEGDPTGTAFLAAAWRFAAPVEIAAKYDGVLVDVDIIVV